MTVSRRAVLGGLIGAVAVPVLSACASGNPLGATPISSDLQKAIERVEAKRFASGIKRKYELTQAATEIDLGNGQAILAKTFNGKLPGEAIRVSNGDLVSLVSKNTLGEDTSVHIHGLALRNDMDGVPGLTQSEIANGSSFTQTFKAPHPGTYWYHSHTGLQPESGLYGSFVIEDPNEKLAYDSEFVIMLDDWTLGIGNTPEQILEGLTSGSGGSGHDMGSMSGMGDMGSGMMGGMSGMSDPATLGLGMSDVEYPAYIINGKFPEFPEVFAAKKNQRIRLRVINAASDTAFFFSLAGTEFTITHTDGFTVKPKKAKAALLGMGERLDVVFTVKSDVTQILAEAVGKTGTPGRAVVKVGSASVPESITYKANPIQVVQAHDLVTTDDHTLSGKPSANLSAMLMGSMSPYSWNINGNTDMHGELFQLREGETARMTIMNHSMMFHPMHLHGHTFQVKSANGKNFNGPRKDTLIVKPMQSVVIDILADNPGKWAFHCHNTYHMHTGMMGAINYKL